jgi:ubiquinone/menaquinone biosynthesis C-methylase UbiE
MGTKEYETNISYKYYWTTSNDIKQFIAFSNQLNEIYNTSPKTVLEVGCGNKLVKNQLESIGIKTICCDINKNLKPDVVGDIRKLPFENNAFDTVVAFEVLEHQPFEDFEKALLELKRVSKKNIIISVPIVTIGLEFYMWLPKIHDIYFYIDIPFPLRIQKVDHYWEANGKGHSKKKIDEIISKHFKILKSYRPKLDKFHLFYILQKVV